MITRESMLKLFSNPSKEFLETCQRIENDANYQPELEPEDLLALVLDENKKPKYDIGIKATGIIPVPKVYIPLDTDGQATGALYVGAFARYCHQGGGWLGSWAWGLDKDLIFVDRKGVATILYLPKNGEVKLDLNEVNIWRKLDDFLNQACLHNEANHHKRGIELK